MKCVFSISPVCGEMKMMCWSYSRLGSRLSQVAARRELSAQPQASFVATTPS
ncbi:MAG: hypothetical protein ACI8RZ_006641, partial [Myxococcota bacterium]